MKPAREKHSNFSSGVEAFFLVLALFDARHVLGLHSSQFMVMLLGNGLLPSGILHFENMGCRELLHPTAP